MSASKKIKDCSKCMEEVKGLLSKCQEWEIKKKEVLEKVKEEPCLNGVRERRDQLDNPDPKGDILYDYGHRGSIQKALDKHKVIKNSVGWETTRTCTQCQGYYARNEYGDETGEKSFVDNNWKESHDCQIKSNQIKSNQIKSNQIKSNQMSNTTNKANYLLWILGGTGLVSLVGIIIYFLVRKENK